MTMTKVKMPLAIVGVGNTLAGDDGAGVEVIRRLREVRGTEPGIILHTLEGDHFEIADLLDQAERFIFVDAVEGSRPGESVSVGNARRAFAPSFHQTDIAAVMHCLEEVGVVVPFPSWALWGIIIDPPSELGEGLTPEVAEAVEKLCIKLCGMIDDTLRVSQWSG